MMTDITYSFHDIRQTSSMIDVKAAPPANEQGNTLRIGDDSLSHQNRIHLTPIQLIDKRQRRQPIIRRMQSNITHHRLPPMLDHATGPSYFLSGAEHGDGYRGEIGIVAVFVGEDSDRHPGMEWVDCW